MCIDLNFTGTIMALNPLAILPGMGDDAAGLIIILLLGSQQKNVQESDSALLKPAPMGLPTEREYDLFLKRKR